MHGRVGGRMHAWALPGQALIPSVYQSYDTIQHGGMLVQYLMQRVSTVGCWCTCMVAGCRPFAALGLVSHKPLSCPCNASHAP